MESVVGKRKSRMIADFFPPVNKGRRTPPDPGAAENDPADGSAPRDARRPVCYNPPVTGSLEEPLSLADLYKVKQPIIEVGRRMYARGMVAANDGNISVRLEGGLFAVTATGVSKGFLTPDDVVVVDVQGKRIQGTKRATSEVKLHLFAFDKRPDVGACCHAHPPYATAFAVSDRRLPRNLLPEVILTVGGEIPVAPYATPSTQELAASIADHVADAEAFLLANHGALTLGADLQQAYHRLETLEHYARIAWLALTLGEARPLPAGESDRLWCVSRGLDPECRSGDA